MIPVGYNAKTIAKAPPWVGNTAVEDILSVSECTSKSPIDHTALWLCNTWRLYGTLAALDAALAQSVVEAPSSLRRFFHEVWPETIVDGTWEPLEEVPTDVAPRPPGFALKGYDIVCFSSGTAPECSPLSCNGFASHVQVNRDCLLPTLDEALAVARRIDAEGGCEPGPYGVMSVWEYIG